jgi:hypothetical protein
VSTRGTKLQGIAQRGLRSTPRPPHRTRVPTTIESLQRSSPYNDTHHVFALSSFSISVKPLRQSCRVTRLPLDAVAATSTLQVRRTKRSNACNVLSLGASNATEEYGTRLRYKM